MTYPHGGDVLAAAMRWGLDPSAVLDFSANINPFGPPPGAVAAARVALGGVHRYPEPYARSLRATLAARHGVPPGSVLVGNGAAEVIHLLLRRAAGRRVALPVPGFAEYGRAARAVGATVVPYTPGDTAPPDADLVLICNPHNPTGRLLTPRQILAIADSTAAGILVDEAFIDLTDAGEAGSVIQGIFTRPNLTVIRSLTKFYAMPGLRVGYAIAPEAVIDEVDAVRDPWSVSPAALAGALAALQDAGYAERVRAWVRTERPYLAAGLAALGYAVEPPSANFVLVRAPEPAHAIQERLGPRAILIRDCRTFEGLTEYHMRLAVRSRAENNRLLEALGT
jgi:threonine-phosphate decarboxylase